MLFPTGRVTPTHVLTVLVYGSVNCYNQREPETKRPATTKWKHTRTQSRVCVDVFFLHVCSLFYAE